MIRHIVLIRFRPGLPRAGTAAIFAKMHAIWGKPPRLLSIAPGRSESPWTIARGCLPTPCRR